MADPWWFAAPHRKACTEQAVLSSTVLSFWAYNPAYAEVQNTRAECRWTDIMRNGLTPKAAAEKAYKQIEAAIFAKFISSRRLDLFAQKRDYAD